MPPKVIVIGAGWAGLSASRTYVRLKPDVDLTILDDDTSVGGVWSSSRLYPGLVADSPRGLFEFSDMSMLDGVHTLAHLDEKGVSGPAEEHDLTVTPAGPQQTRLLEHGDRYGLLSGKEVHNYLYNYAAKWDLLRRTKLNSRILKAKRIQRDAGASTGWRITLASGEELDCDKLIVASGLYSRPSIPSISGRESFAGITLHSKTLGRQYHEICGPSIRFVVVVGACKSALDALNLCLALPQRPHIHWIIRRREHGVPILLNDPCAPLCALVVNNNRLFCALSPSIYDTDSWLYRLFHSGHNRIGTWLVTLYWYIITWIIFYFAEYDRSEQGKMIMPQREAIFRGLQDTCLIQKGSPVFEEIHKGERISLHVGNLQYVSENHIVLAKEHSPVHTVQGYVQTKLQADCIIWCTGSKTSASFFSPEDAADLGLPIPIEHQSPAQRTHWNKLQDAADAEIVSLFPQLAQYPIEPLKEPTTNYRMYRHVLSPKLLAANDRSICFAGFVSNTQTAFSSELTALWGIAWMEGLLTMEDLAGNGDQLEMEKDVARVNAWMSRRYGARGNMQPGIILEVQTYFDKLVKDLGCEVHRKSALREYLGIYSAADYKGLVDEVLHRRGNI